MYFILKITENDPISFVYCYVANHYETQYLKITVIYYFLCSVDWMESSSAGSIWAHSHSCISLGHVGQKVQDGLMAAGDASWGTFVPRYVASHSPQPKLIFIDVFDPILKVIHRVTLTTCLGQNKSQGQKRFKAQENKFRLLVGETEKSHCKEIEEKLLQPPLQTIFITDPKSTSDNLASDLCFCFVLIENTTYRMKSLSIFCDVFLTLINI